MLQFGSARELFEAAQEASRDAERIRRQLAAMESRADGLGGGGFEAHVSGTSDPDKLGRAVAAMVDMEERLRERQEWDYRLLDLASAVLYGRDNDSGLWTLCGWRADAIFHHYIGGMTWEEVGVVMGYTADYCQQQARCAMEVCDGWGLVSVMAGRGGAEG